MANVQTILDEKGSKVFTIGTEDSLAHALLKLTEHKIGALLVVDEEKNIKGILSERDIIRHFSRKLEHLNTASINVREVMTTAVTHVNPSQSLDDCLKLMTAGHFRHLPVVSEGKLVGMISIGDVVKLSLHERDFQIGELEQYITSPY
ncbi:CBS domain-containing protein [Sphaerochaeta sp. PS]|uniref:CBS domain-containing protein n=1 Tax=Sphaerochaeta sp. PS TaxID=3076336 RepID=UPI0028A397AC|nr:CBS domain-containing protein [Sphaerochaeta sp. PS]MDT4762078.1 CBS domain-containing protein [Sphaerochaeta sp. PS]